MASLVKEEFLFHNSASWLFYYASDLIFVAIICLSAYIPCSPDSPKASIKYLT